MVTFFGVSRAEGVLNLVVEFVPDGSLDEFLRYVVPSVPQAVQNQNINWFITVGNAYSYLYLYIYPYVNILLQVHNDAMSLRH